MLNPELFQKLRRYVDAQAVVIKENERFRGRLVPEVKIEGGEVRRFMRIETGDGKGEEYRANCYVCGDRRKRLYINHLFGTDSEHEGVSYNYLVKCFNNDCFQNPLQRQLLMFRLRLGHGAGVSRRQRSIDIQEVSETEIVRTPEDLPELQLEDCRVISLETLYRQNPRHEAFRFFADRMLSWRRIAKTFHVQYIEQSWGPSFLQGRFFCPIFYKGKQIGWQSRLARKPHYEDEARWITGTGMKVGMCFYNWDVAVRYKLKVIVEGASDVWNLGPRAIGCFKKSLSRGQLNLLAATDRPENRYVVMLDPDQPRVDVESGAEHHIRVAARALERLPGFQGRVIPVWLPKGQDPGSIDSLYAWELIRNELSRRSSDLD